MSSRSRHGVNSIPELELMVNSNSNSGIGIDYFGIGIDYFGIGIGIGIEVCHKKLNPQINHYHLYLLFYLFY
jgi:hypothetical protein